MAPVTPEIAPESPPSQVGRARLLWPTTFTPQANLESSAPSIQNSVAHAAATSAAASARCAARPATSGALHSRVDMWLRWQSSGTIA